MADEALNANAVVEQSEAAGPVAPQEQLVRVPSWYNPERATPGLTELMSTLPVGRAASYDDIVEQIGDRYRIRPTFGAARYMPPSYPDPFKGTTTAGETFQASWNTKLISSSYRAVKRWAQNRADTQTFIDPENYFASNWAAIPESIQTRYVSGRYDHLRTEESLFRLMIHDQQVDRERIKIADGSKWAANMAGAIDFALITLPLELLTLPAPGAGTAISASLRGAGRLALAVGKQSAKLAVPQRYLRNRFLRQMGTDALERGKLLIPTELGAGTGMLGSRSALSLSKTAYALRGMGTWGVLSGSHSAGLKLLEDDREWRDVAFDTAFGAAMGGGLGFVRGWGMARRFQKAERDLLRMRAKGIQGTPEFLAQKEVVAGFRTAGPQKLRIKMRRAAKHKAKKAAGSGSKPRSQMTHLEKVAQQSQREMEMKMLNPVNMVRIGTQNYVGDFLKGLGWSEAYASAGGGWARVAVMVLPFAVVPWIGGKLGIPLSLSILSMEGLQDFAKSYMIQKVSKVLEGKGVDLPSFGADINPDAAKLLKQQESVMGALLNKRLPEATPIEIESDIEGIADPEAIIEAVPDVVEEGVTIPEALFEGKEEEQPEPLTFLEPGEFEAMWDDLLEFTRQNFAKQDADLYSDMFASSVEPLRELLNYSSVNIATTTHSPELLRGLAKSYREQARIISDGPTVGDIYEDMAGRVAMDNPDTQEFQENLDYRYYSTLRQIDQSDLTSSLDDKGLEYVGNLTIRVIAGSLATLLEAKADGRLADEVNKLGNDDEWFLETSKAMLSDFVEEVAMMSVYGFDVIGRHRDYGDQDQYIYETIIEGYANGAMSDEISGTLTEEQIEVTAFYEMSNVATLFGSFQTVLGEILPNEGINEPDEIERSDMYHEATRIAAVERQAPSDVTITEDINQPQGIEII